MHYRTARATWTPIDWPAFCRKALDDANQAYRQQLLSQATDSDLADMHRELMSKRAENRAQADAIEAQLRDIDRERVLRTAT